MTSSSIAAQPKRYALTTTAPILGGGKGKFYLISTRKTKAGRSTKWHFDPTQARTWKTRRAVDEFQFAHRYLKARVALAVKP